MPQRSTNRFIFIWLFAFLPLIAVFVFRKSFNLGLYGDDWQHLYNLWRDFFVYHTKSFYDIRSYLNPYWPEYFYLGIINHFWGYYPPAYFIASYLSRLFANISLYFFTFELTGSKLAAILSTIIFLFSAAGLQTTDWVFNMNTYAGLGLLSLASVFYLKIRKLNTIYSFNYILFIMTFILALAIVPTRMHGAVPFLIIVDLFLTFVAEKSQFKINRFLLIRIIMTILVFVLLLHLKSFGEGSFTTDRLSESSQILQKINHKGYYAIWFYFLGILGHLVLPDSISLDNFTSVIFLTNGISIILGIIVSWLFSKGKSLLFYLPILIFNFIWTLILGWIVSINPNPLYTLNPYLPSDVLFSIALGGQFIFWSIWLSILSGKSSPQLSSSLIISLIWIIMMTIIYWLFTPYYLIETTSRYMLMGATGIAIFLGSFVSLLFFQTVSLQKNEKTRILSSFYLLLAIFILLFWIFTNFQRSQTYLGILEQTRNRELTEKTWNTLLKDVPKLDPIGPSVFYFTTDNPLSLQGVLVFGFFMRAGMTYKIPDQDLTPLPSTDYQELLSYVTDGSPLQKVHGRKPLPVPLSRIYAFDFRNGVLINITTAVRNKLTEDLKTLNK
ncbi:hypothetical protein HYW41_01900 [Candidatus Daviesbacteria bacterium]|nr:hypothetical protein [Candidatus Daviesbacteria bacterium]